MKILFVHNKYQHQGGEDTVLGAEMDLFSTQGHQVFLAKKENDSINSFFSKVKVFRDVTYSKQSKLWMIEELNKYNPDIVHVHNFFPLLSPSIYDACIEAKIPVIQTLHNYRTICPSALLMRDGIVCENCVKSSPFNAVIHKCYKDSLAGSFAVAKMVSHHRKIGTWNIKVNCFIALTQFAKEKFVDGGFPESKIQVKPNFVDDMFSNDKNIIRNGALFVGRLSEEKGMATLLKAWNNINIPLRIAGTGPLEFDILQTSNQAIKALGSIDKETVIQEMSQAAFLVMPSECYEGFPMVLVEAFSQGLSVVASRLGGMAEIVEDGITGLHFEAGNAEDLAEKVQWLHDHPEERAQMGFNARKIYEQKYTPEKNYEILMDIYQQAIKDSQESVIGSRNS